MREVQISVSHNMPPACDLAGELETAAIAAAIDVRLHKVVPSDQSMLPNIPKLLSTDTESALVADVVNAPEG